MDARRFFDTVALMRNAQREYFKYRRKSDLNESRRLERIVDDEINRVHGICGVPPALKPAPGLFDNPNNENA